MSQMSLSGECVFSVTTKKKGYFDGFILCVLILLTHIYFRSKKQKDAVFMSAQRTFKINDRERKWDLSSRMSCMYEKSTTIYTSLIYRQKDDVK